ncbi:MAG: hypothetical protein LIO63_03860 [Akkermansia sp.]|nr:hypothetical protein [Akkermansia sp.]
MKNIHSFFQTDGELASPPGARLEAREWPQARRRRAGESGTVSRDADRSATLVIVAATVPLFVH